MPESQLTVVTTNYVPGNRITKVLGPTFGIIVRSRGLGGNIVAGLRGIVGGEIDEYTKMLSEAREHAIARMEENAKALGANAVVEMRFDSADIGQIMTEVVAYGTAVIIEQDISKPQPVSLR
ncbi:MAG: heavy metal-binding domain-containing protein [Candidatus Micrarchaeota archaeon]|nr:heavy metal-binding domain-containing protein [Candidatus Micrarchaeota archaeon]MDE1833952.1 heavy metal-binding domain-containing protein [Candidatus Micrarchaeota archaeon]MDE1859828.1 heavy metal-binding domain-containing protein [Candidatus Micrarchaeota archaeon]